MRQPIILTTILAAALIAGPGTAAAQDFEDDFDSDFDDDFDDGDDDDFGGDFGDDSSGSTSTSTSTASDGDATASGSSGEERGIGVGAIAPLGNFGGLGFFLGAGPAVTYDMGDFHIDGILTFATNGETAFGLAGRFWYHLFQHASSDFSVGGGFSYANVSNDVADDSANLINVEAGAKIRMFLVPQVALSQTTGFVIGLGDAEGVVLGGQVLGGITYFFD